MFSGHIQSGLSESTQYNLVKREDADTLSRYRNMNNRLGLAAWRWVFIFDFIIGIPIAVFGLFCCPGTNDFTIFLLDLLSGTCPCIYLWELTESFLITRRTNQSLQRYGGWPIESAK